MNPKARTYRHVAAIGQIGIRDRRRDLMTQTAEVVPVVDADRRLHPQPGQHVEEALGERSALTLLPRDGT